MAEKAFNTASMAHMDISMRAMMDRSYDVCLFSCMTRREEVGACKNSCFKTIQVPYRYANHVGRDNEDANYRKCLAKRPNFPVLNPQDFTVCSNNLYQERVEAMSNYVAE